MIATRFSYLLLLLLLVYSFVSARVTNDLRMNNYDVTHYDLTIAFDLQHKTFSGNVRVQAAALEPIEEFVLCAANETLTIDSVLYHGGVAPFHHTNDHVNIKLSPAILPLEQLTLTVFYHGISTFKGQYEGGGVYFTQSDSVRRVATISQPFFARNWWPCKDLPSDKATASITVTVPDPLTAVSNGLLKNKEHHGETTTYTWETQYPIATYLVSIAAAEYKKFSETYTAQNGKQMPVDYYVFPNDVEKAKKDFENTRKVLAFLSASFCEYPFIDEKFGYAEVEGSLTMENQTICSIEEGLITGDKKYEMTIIHETCHHWWGDLITPMSWRHTWLNEGFATYTEALYLEHEKGTQAYDAYIHNIMAIGNGKLAGSVVGRSDTAFWDSFSERVYFKGAVVLHMLRKMLGDSAFFSAMKNYINNPALRYGTATTADFLHECEQSSGQNLRWFFDQWVYAYTDSIDRPEIEYHWTSQPGSPMYNIVLELKQLNASKLVYKLPLSVSLSNGQFTTSFSVVDSLASQSFTFAVPEKPAALDIDKEEKIFKIIKKRD